jgi:hypothetical protein
MALIEVNEEDRKLLVEGLNWLYNAIQDSGPPDYLPTERHRKVSTLRQRLEAMN